MRYVLIVVGILLVAILAIVVIGWALPVKHVATKSVQLSASPDSVFALISTPEGYPSWRSDVKNVDVTTENGVTRGGREWTHPVRDHGESPAAPVRDDDRGQVAALRRSLDLRGRTGFDGISAHHHGRGRGL